MITVFVSYAPPDEDLAAEVADELRREGLDEPFVLRAFAPTAWSAALRAAAVECRAVIALITEDWLMSAAGGFDDLLAAARLGKRIVALVMADAASLDPAARARLGAVRAEGWVVAETPERSPLREAGVRAAVVDALRAAGGASAVGLDPSSFAVDQTRRPSPFLGLAAFDDADADAAIFFGRGREIAEVLETLRAHRAERRHPPLGIVGDAGVGKTSLLHAGVMPRLRREAPAWLVVRPMRVEDDPLFAMADALCSTLADFGAAGDARRLQDALMSLWSTGRTPDGQMTDVGRTTLGSRLHAEGERLRAAAGRPGATLLIGIDGAERLFDGDDGTRAALAYLGAASLLDGVQLVFTARYDAVEALAAAPDFDGVAIEPYPLRPLPAFRFDEVIAGPAARYGTMVPPSLIDDFMMEASASDELPLLAWGLRRLWSDGVLGRQESPPVDGWLAERVETVADAALGGASNDALGARTFVPALLRLDGTQSSIGPHGDVPVTAHEARWAEFPAEGQAVLERFLEVGLVRRHGETVAVAHRSLFRRWSRLQRWLGPERERLQARQALTTAADAWDQGGRRDGDLGHTGDRLEAMLASTKDETLRHFEMDYLRACEVRDRAVKARRWQQRIAAAGVAAIAVVAIWAVFATFGLRGGEPPRSPPGPGSVIAFEPTVLTTTEEAMLEPGDTFTECKTGCPTMVVVPAGTFLMGDERAASEVALPRHPVTIARPFAVAQTEVTVREWSLLCRTEPACSGSDYTILQHELDPHKPYASASWMAAKWYIRRLSTLTGRRYRLLSEAEWEYVARATSTTAYAWGDDIGQGRAHCAECGVPLEPHFYEADDGTYANDGAPVASYAPNLFGLYDTHGNQWEIVEDCWHPSYVGAPGDGSSWLEDTDGDCSLAVIRGGSVTGTADRVRSAIRDFIRRDIPAPAIGFRVARDLGPSPPRVRGGAHPLAVREEAKLLPGDTFTECEDCPSMIVVPAGRFVMGDEREEDLHAMPRHAVSIPRRFAVSRTEVTVRQALTACRTFPECIEAVTEIGDTGHPLEPSVGLGNNVEGYAMWLSWKTGKRYRLLSEAEWEYVARATSTTAYSWGDDIGDGRAHCRGCGDAFNPGVRANRKCSTEGAFVGSFAPNAFGVFDMHGNVWERVKDCWHASYEGAPDDGAAWMGADGGDCSRAVLRGGGVLGPADQLRSSVRRRASRSDCEPLAGFRVARDLEPGPARPRPVPELVPKPLSAKDQRGLLPGDTFTECQVGCPYMVVVPSGSFLMGDEREQEQAALPRRRVTVERPFAVGRTEVTSGQWDLYCRTTGACRPTPAPDRRVPRSGVSRETARGYVTWLAQATGRPYRLLSEAEWEYVARAGSETAYAWGDEFREGRAVCEECGMPTGVDAISNGDDRGVALVGTFAANDFGVFDTHGNLWELVDDCWHDSYVGAPTDGTSWRAADGGQCDRTVIRGGSRSARPERLRSASRAYIEAGATADSVGFRVARDLVVTPVESRPQGGCAPRTEAEVQATEFAPFVLSAKEESRLLPGDVFRECKLDCPSMVVVPAGAFVMGDEQDEDDGTRPRHRVVFDRPFAVGRTEVTVAHVDLHTRAGACGGPRPPVDVRKPANFVSWDGAQTYVQWLSRMTGRRYRLLSESEWEYVARAGSQTRYAWGDSIGVSRAHCQTCGGAFDSHAIDEGGYSHFGAPAGWFAPNAFGIFDVHGNVWELVQDCWHSSYAGAPSDGSAWMAEDHGACSRVVLRGGGMFGSPERIRAIVRDRVERTVNRPDIGFRVARDLSTRALGESARPEPE